MNVEEYLKTISVPKKYHPVQYILYIIEAYNKNYEYIQYILGTYMPLNKMNMAYDLDKV